MNIKPLRGQVLVRVIPPDLTTHTGLFIPDIANDVPHGSGRKQHPFKAVVVAMGPWKQTKNGYGILPDFGIGSTVICTPYAGQKLSRDIGERLQLVKSEDVLAKVEIDFGC